jgi:riboflavin kinase/FMN adenylyltransferase
MQVVSSLAELPALGLRRVALTCGVFDGVHPGHRLLLATTQAAAAREQAAPVVFTFHPHPAVVLCPEQAPRLLLSESHKLSLLADAGMAATVQYPFTPAVAAVEPEAFLDEVIGGSGITLTSVCVGANWRFGYRARGDLALLQRYGARYGFSVAGVPEVLDEGRPISSTRIRAAVAAGELATAERLLGRPFSIQGVVEHGKGIGTAELHYPTANIHAENQLFPPPGIYASRAHLRRPDGAREASYDGILYLGYAPTFVHRRHAPLMVEMHIFDFHADIYGRVLEVEFLGFIRGDAKFASVAALAEQIGRDIVQAKALLHQRSA